MIGSIIALVSLVFAVLCAFVDWYGDRKDTDRGLAVVAATADETVRLSDIAKFGQLYWFVTISCVTTYVACFPFMGVISQPYLDDRFGFDSTAADQITANVNLVSALLSPILGLLVDKFG